MLAPSFRDAYDIISEVFTEGDKEYIMIKHKNTGNQRKARWYPDPHVPGKMYKTQKDVLGFELGYITIFSGNQEANEEYFRNSNARRCQLWDWYIISTEEVPNDLPENIIAIELTWDSVGNEDGTLKSFEEIRKVISSLRAGDAKFVGRIGDRIETVLTVVKNYKKDTNYGISYSHTMKDSHDNVFVWHTSAQNWSVGTTHRVRGTIKDHVLAMNGGALNILTRCVER